MSRRTSCGDLRKRKIGVLMGGWSSEREISSCRAASPDSLKGQASRRWHCT